MKSDSRPPKWVDAWLENFAPDNLAEEIKGDLYEMYCKDLVNNPKTANRKYVFNAIGFFAKSFFWKNKTSIYPNSNFMIFNYFRIARRTLLANKGNTIINILGLVVGIASALVIINVIRHELSFDSFHTNASRTYRVVRVTGPDITIADQSEYRTGVCSPLPLAIREGASGIESITSVQYFGGAFVEIPDKSGAITRRFQEERGCVAVEPAFFSMFDFKGTDFRFLSGNAETSLRDPYSIVLTKKMAAKYFPDSNALGMTIKFEKRFDFKVTGIIEDLPYNSDFPFGVLISYSTLKAINGKRNDDWLSLNDSNQAFLIPAKGTSKTEVERQIAKIHAAHTPKDISASRHYLLQELKDVHFDPRFGNFNGRTITRDTLYTLGIIAIFLLLTGCINYINLATAQSTMRSKEIGLRKVMGSNRASLTAQFFIETFVVVLIASLIALTLSEILLMNLQSLLNINFDGNVFKDPFILESVLFIAIVVTLLSTFYPSIVISGFSPVSAMKNKFGTESIGGISLRKVLVVTQFAITQMLVIGTFIVVLQMRYFENSNMGFNREAVISVDVPDRDPAKLKVLSDQLQALASVSGVTYSYTLPSGLHRNQSSSSVSRTRGASFDDQLVYEFQSVDTAYLGLYHIKLLAGRNFQSGDSSKYILVNRTLVKNLQLGRPEDAVGKEVWLEESATIIGVFDDFYNSLKDPVNNMVMFLNPRAYSTLSIKLSGNDSPRSFAGAISQIDKIWSSSFPEYIFEYQFLDENIKAYYVQEQKYAQLFQLFSIIFLLIGSLGLYGLITFVVNRKGKEIAVRKVLGATISNILLMFSREYIQLIFISLLLSVPISYYVVDNWLSNFAHHIELHWWLLLIPGLSVILIALLVIATKSLRAASSNPIDKLRYE